MSDFDYSKLSDEELDELLHKSSNQEDHQAEPGLFKSALQGYGNYAKGFGKGAGQVLGDIGASVINWPLAGIEKGTGHKMPRVPHPHLLEGNPHSFAESIGRTAGGLLPMVIPGAGGVGAARLVGQGAPAIARLLAGAAGGALTGAAGSEGHRSEGALLGGIGGDVGAGIPMMPHLTRHGASRHLRQAHNLAQERNIGALNVPHELIEDTRQFLPTTAPYRNMMERAQGREYPELFNLQSDVGRQSSGLSRSLFSAAERAHGREGLATRERLLESIRNGLREQGHHDIADLMQRGQRDYRRHMAIRPYLNVGKGLAIGAGVNQAFPNNPVSEIIKHLLLHRPS